MAFFNLTLLGPQDPFKAAVREPGKDKNPGVSSPAHHPSSTNPVATTPPGPTAAGLELETSGPEQKSPASGQGESPSKPEQKATQTSTESAEELPPLHPSLIAAPPFAERKFVSYKHCKLLTAQYSIVAILNYCQLCSLFSSWWLVPQTNGTAPQASSQQTRSQPALPAHTDGKPGERQVVAGY